MHLHFQYRGTRSNLLMLDLKQERLYGLGKELEGAVLHNLGALLMKHGLSTRY